MISLMCMEIFESDACRCFIESLKSREFADGLHEGLQVYERTGEVVGVTNRPE